jgi:hypothetical protein
MAAATAPNTLSLQIVDSSNDNLEASTQSDVGERKEKEMAEIPDSPVATDPEPFRQSAGAQRKAAAVAWKSARIAIVQKAPAFLDRAECLRIAVSAVAEAAAGGARLVVFPEAFIPGYPAWIWRLRPGGDMALSERLHRALLENAVDLSGDDLAPLCEAARKHRVTVVCGINERDGAYSPRHPLQHSGDAER